MRSHPQVNKTMPAYANSAALYCDLRTESRTAFLHHELMYLSAVSSEQPGAFHAKLLSWVEFICATSQFPLSA